MSSDDSLVTTRARRANAGSRLKQLIELENQSNELQETLAQIVDDEDENVNLLFQEDDDDMEFVEEKSSDIDNDDDDDDDDNDGRERDEEEESRDADTNDTTTATPSAKDELRELLSDAEEGNDGGRVHSDDVLSDSDISVSATDEDEGEKELQTQELLKKRKLKRQQRIIPTIKKAKLDIKPDAKAKTARKRVSQATSESLMMSARRSSSRAAAVENKQALVERLKESEKRKAKFTPIVREKEPELTQEERLAQAVETEKENILSLNQFREQEIVKKEHRKQLLLSRREKLKNVIRSVTRETFVTPLDEVKDARHVDEMFNSKSKKKPGRRKKHVTPEDAEPKIRLPGEIDTELPIVKAEIERKKKEEEDEARKQGESNSIEQQNGDRDSGGSENDNEDGTLPECDGKNISVDENGKELSTEDTASVSDDKSAENGIDNGSSTSNEVHEDDAMTEKPSGDSIDTEAGAGLESNHGESPDPITADESLDTKNPNAEDNEAEIGDVSQADHDEKVITPKGENDDSNQTSPADEDLDGETANQQDREGDAQAFSGSIDEQESKPEVGLASTTGEHTAFKEGKKVTFAGDTIGPPGEETPSVETPSGSIQDETASKEEGEIFEGPPQRVARNILYFFDFDEEDKDLKLTPTNIKTILLGPQAHYPASRRFKDTKTILRIGHVDNPYAVVKQEKSPLFTSVSELTEDDPMFDELRRLPRLGVAQDTVEEVEENAQEEETVINLKTEAPTGLYLPNGNKKNCMITGGEVKYFDPSNGLPYSSVEAYRVLKSIEQGNVPWLSLSPEFNSWGGAEIYLGSRDGSVRHATGVPPGFAE